MRKIKTIVILLNLVALLVYFNYSIMGKEAILDEGKLILLELAPIDPRSLMQGDYMRLRYAIANNIKTDSIPKRGYCVVKLDSEDVAQRVRIQSGQTPLNNGEFLIEYNTNQWTIDIGAESYFFEEGQAERFDNAKYGGLKIDEKGNSVLVGLYDEHQKLIE